MILMAGCLMVLACKKDKIDNTVTDIDGNVYKTVKIGDQVWMAENLRTIRFNDGQPITYAPNYTVWNNANNNFPMITYYKNDYSNFVKYGVMYNFLAIETDKLAPKGWHVATETDYQKLESYLIAHGFNYDGSTSVNKIAKSLASTSGWEVTAIAGSPGNEQVSNNRSGLNILPGGYLIINDAEGFKGVESQSNFWTATGANQAEGKAVVLFGNDFETYLYLGNKRNGAYVRCVKD